MGTNLLCIVLLCKRPTSILITTSVFLFSFLPSVKVKRKRLQCQSNRANKALRPAYLEWNCKICKYNGPLCVLQILFLAVLGKLLHDDLSSAFVSKKGVGTLKVISLKDNMTPNPNPKHKIIEY